MNQRMGTDPSQYTPPTDEFHNYLKAEYAHIAEAHFRTIEAISSFFRYYLLIMSAPIAIFGVFVGLSDNIGEVVQVVESLRPLLIAVLTVISVVGLLVMLYIVNLRMDVILYARTVNAIRKHFYDQAMMEVDTKLRTRVLPQTPVQPGYEEPSYFLPVVFSFAFLDTLYLGLSLALFGGLFQGSTQIHVWSHRVALWPWSVLLLSGLIFWFGHWFFYRWFARHRERAYLRSSALGVDIDGVLNKHREHFCSLLREKVRKLLDPANITTIPLHDCPELGVSRKDESRVFNDPKYWVDMPVAEGAKENLRRLRNILNLKVHIFSHRPWPDTAEIGEPDAKQIDDQWNAQTSRLVKEAYPSWIRRIAQRKLRGRPIDVCTKWWLRQNKIGYDNLTIEQGSEYVSDPQGHFCNRFFIAREKKLRFFVEDDLEKAIKLAYICDVVFLLDHPYNRNSPEKCLACDRECKQSKREVPNNVIGVKSWDEIYRQIRRLS